MNNEIFRKYGDRLLFALALAILAAALFHFGLVNRAGNNKTATEEDLPRVVFFTQWWDNDSELVTLKSLIEEFESLNAEIKIDLNTIPYEDLRKAVFDTGRAHAREDEKNPGDIVALDPLWIPELLDWEIIENVNETSVFFINVFYYNIEILRQAGFSSPPKTRSEFLSYARTLASMQGFNGVLAMGLNSSRGIYDDIFPWIWSSGAQLITNGNGRPTLTSRPVVESLSFLATLNSEGLIAPGSFSANSEKKLEDFISGRAAFLIAPARDIDRVRERLGDEAFGVTSIPAPDNVAQRSLFGTSGWTTGVYSGSDHKEEAKLFAEFLAEKSHIISREVMAIPGSGIPPAQDELFSKVWDIAIAGESAQDFSGLPWTRLEEIFRNELAAMFGGRSTPAETAAVIQAKWELVLGR